MIRQSFLISSIVVLFVTAGCVDDDPCDPGQVFQDGYCVTASPTDGSGGSDAASGGADAGGGAGGAGGATDSTSNADCYPGSAAAADEGLCGNWGDACESNDDCVGGTVCADQLSVCTQGSCLAGEENEDICPPDWQCFSTGVQSGCVNF